MILYHGSNVEIRRPQIMSQDKGRDFGCGFYTTSIREQAERWAVRKARLFSRLLRNKSVPVVNVYEFDESAVCRMKSRDFANPDTDWLDFVVRCRSNLEFRHEYDIVSGKIADDTVGETVEYVLAGIMRKEDAVDRLRFERINDQICFCTERALSSLVFVESYTIDA